MTLTAVHPHAPVSGHADIWQRELALIRQTLATVDGPQVVAGDFNASRDHRPFRDLLAAGFLDCADSSQSRSWPGFTWPAARGMLPVMRLDHVLVSRTATVRMTRVIRLPRTDHHGVLAAIEFTRNLTVKFPVGLPLSRGPGQQPDSNSPTRRLPFPTADHSRPGSRTDGQAAYFCTREPTLGSAAMTCLAAPPRTARYAFKIVGRSECSACASVTESRASDTSSPRLAR